MLFIKTEFKTFQRTTLLWGVYGSPLPVGWIYVCKQIFSPENFGHRDFPWAELVERDFVFSSLGVVVVVSSKSWKLWWMNDRETDCDQSRLVHTRTVWNWTGLGGYFGGWWPIRLWKERGHVWQGLIGATSKANVILIEKRGNWMSEGKNNAGISLIGFYSIALRDLFLNFNAIKFKKMQLICNLPQIF